MNRLSLLAAVAAVTVMAAAGVLFLSGSDHPANQQPAVSESSARQPVNKLTAGRYVDFSNDEFAKTDNTRVLFFYAAWCPQCRQLDADIKAKGVPAGYTFIKVDFDASQALRELYGVTIQSTLVKIDKDDKLVQKYVAYDEPTLENVKQNLL